MPNGQPETQVFRVVDESEEDRLEVLSRFSGWWSPDATRMPAEFAEWRARNEVEDGRTSFEWGTGRRWIEFGDHRRQNGVWRVEGSGLLAWDTHRQAIVYHEHSDPGVALEGTVMVVDDHTVRRYYRSYPADGSAHRWVDTWRWESEDDRCFSWTTAAITPDGEQPWPTYWMCPVDAPVPDGG